MLHSGPGAGGEQNLAFPPHTRPQVRTWAFFGRNALPQTTHVRSAVSATSVGKAIRYLPLACCRTVTNPDPSTFMTISGSIVVNLADAESPSPNQVPRAYGGIGRSASGHSIAVGRATAWLRRCSIVWQRSVAAICSVVTTSGGTGSA